MATSVTVPRRIMWLDYDRDLTRDLGTKITERFPEVGVWEVDHPADARDRLLESAEDAVPDLFISDRVGTQPLLAGKRVAEIVREVAPLAPIILFSRSAFQEPKEVPELVWNRLIDRPIHKDHLEELFEALEFWHGQLGKPLLTDLLEDIRASENPHLPYVYDGNGRGLSLCDEYREILVGTPLGKHLQAADDYRRSGRTVEDLLAEVGLKGD